MDTTPAAAPEAKTSWFETVVTSTPVLLTVIATFMVGQSSGEMTRAQYYRSVAGQDQAKAGDQWGFFQAKRIRGQILEGNADLLLAQPRAAFSRDTFPDAAQAMVNELRAAEKAVEMPALGAKPSPLESEEMRALKAAAGELNWLAAEAEKALATTQATFTKPSEAVFAAQVALQGKPLKKSTDGNEVKQPPESSSVPAAKDTEQTLLLKDIVEDVKKRKADKDITPKVLKLAEETLNQAIQETERKADEIFQRGKSVENVLEEFDALAEQQAALAFAYQQILSRLKSLLDKTEPGAPGKAPLARTALEATHKTLERRGEAIRALPARLYGDYKAARHAYSARRYEDDARGNQDSAYLFQVRVHFNSALSDKHLFRSRMFLLAMLVAQAGVTIATLALAVKRRSVFWLLAALSGLIAIGFGAYVYLDLWPMPSF